MFPHWTVSASENSSCGYGTACLTACGEAFGRFPTSPETRKPLSLRGSVMSGRIGERMPCKAGECQELMAGGGIGSIAS